MLEFITDKEIYDKVICERIPKARKYLWLATADLKDLHVDKQGRMVPLSLAGMSVEPAYLLGRICLSIGTASYCSRDVWIT
jgi:hypothetical protein